MKSKRHRPTVKIFRTPKGKSEKSLLNSGNIAAAAAVVAGVVVGAGEGAVAILQDGTAAGVAAVAAAVADHGRHEEVAAADARELAAKPSGRIIRA